MTRGEVRFKGKVFRARLVSLPLLMLSAALILILSVQPGLVLASSAESAGTYQPPLEISISADSAVVIDSGRLRRLYAKAPDARMSIPAAAKIMTALLACERLPLDTQVTISNVAAAAAALESTGDDLELKTGDKYPLEYLLLRLFFYDSDAAALAIAEQISNVEERFVELMNAKAASLELGSTFFMNSTGEPVYSSEDPSPEADETGTIDTYRTPLHYSTTADVARLISFAMQNQNFARTFRKDSEYIVLDGNTLVSMRNRIQPVWTLSENRISGAYYGESFGRSYSIAIARIKDFNIIMVTAGGSPGQRIGDLLAMANSVEDTYVQTALVTAGESYTGHQEQTADGEIFGLVFKKTIPYIHPLDDNFLETTVQYNSFGPHSRPIEYTMTVGQVIFKLKDGSVVAADVGPDRQILSNITLFNQLLNVLQTNRNLFYVIMAASASLLLIMLVQLAVSMTHLVRLIQLVLFEKRSRIDSQSRR